MVQEFLNRRLQTGDSIRKVQVMRTVLSAALCSTQLPGPTLTWPLTTAVGAR